MLFILPKDKITLISDKKTRTFSPQTKPMFFSVVLTPNINNNN